MGCRVKVAILRSSTDGDGRHRPALSFLYAQVTGYGEGGGGEKTQPYLSKVPIHPKFEALG